MKKNGFTLAEVLITLLIVGVVATLTTPALVKNVGSSKIGPQLSKFVNTWETGMETMMMEENVSSLATLNNKDTTASTHYRNRLSKYIIMTRLNTLKSPASITLKKADGTDYKSVTMASGTIYQLKDGTILIYDEGKPAMSEWSYSANGAYKGASDRVLVDIGGLKGSHRLGKEVFGFIVDSSGVLVPYGSNAHKAMKDSFKTECNPSSSNVEANLACTGAVADNGWKAPW